MKKASSQPTVAKPTDAELQLLGVVFVRPTRQARLLGMITTSINASLVIAVLLVVSTGGPRTLVLGQQASPAQIKEVEQVREVIGRYDAEYWKAVDAASLVRNKQAVLSTDDWWLALLRDKQLLVIETRTGHVAQRHAVQGDQLQWGDDSVLVTDSGGGGSESIQVRRQLLRYVDERGKSVQVNALVKANIGYLSTGSQWSTWPHRDGVISLAGLQRSTHWLVPQPHHEVFRVILPLVDDQIEQHRHVPSPLNTDDISVTTHVHKRSYENAEMVGVRITNLTDKPIHVSEQDIHLDTEIDGKQFEVLSPTWRLAEKANFPAVDLPPQATSSLELDWNAWVNQGFWISGGVQFGLGPWPAERRPGKVWVRVNVRHMGALPVALRDPSNSVIDTATAQQDDGVQDVVLQQLFDQYVNVNGKIPTAEVKAAIELVAARGARNRAFQDMVLVELEKRSRADNDRTVRRNLLAVITKWLQRDGGRRWQHEYELRTGDVGQAAMPQDASVLYANSPMLAKVIQLGRQADSSDIYAYVLAVRGAHHPQGKSFLSDVLGNWQAGGDPFEFYKHHPAPPAPETAWSDRMGGSWRDAKFHAAVGLAEVSNSRGIDWLIAAVQPNGFGIDGTVFRGMHARQSSGSLRLNSAAVLADLFGLPPTTTGPEWQAWWQANKQPVVKGRAALSEW